MAAPVYSTDLILVTDASSGVWIELPGYTAGGAPAIADTDYFVQGTSCTSQATAGKTGLVVGMEYDSGAIITMAAGECFFTWMVFLTANAIDTWELGGMRFGVGDISGSHRMWKAVGNDFGRNPYGGWQNIAIDPTFTPDYIIGTPGTAYRFFASLLNLTGAVARGNVHGIDAIRRGRGKLQVTLGDATLGYGTFAGMATFNDAIANRFGLFQTIAGAFLWKGLMSLGSAVDAVDFRDSNKSIVVDATPRTYASFSKIEVRNAASRVDFTNISFSALGILARGDFEAVDNAVINLVGCTFSDMGTWIFKAATIADGSTWRRCNLITQNGATIKNSTISNTNAATTATLLDNPGLVSYNDFISSGTKHAIEITVAGAYSFVGNQFTGYAGINGTTGNEAIFNNTGGLVTLNISGGGSSPTIRNGTGASTVVNNTKTLTITGIQPLSDVVILTSGTSTELVDVNEIVGTTYTYSYAYVANTNIDICVFKAGYVPFFIRNYLLPNADGSLPVSQVIDRAYQA